MYAMGDPGLNATVVDPASRDALDETLAAAGSPHPSVAPQNLRSTRPSVLPRVEAQGDDIRLVHDAVARYRTIAHLGAGGMGEVEQADDVDIGRSVAIKRLLPEAANTSGITRFVQEVRIVGNLEHPNVVPLHDVGLDAHGRYFFVMKYANGETLERIIERLQAHEPEARAEYTFERRIEIFLGILRALEYAHAQGVIHRDVKPANVMVGRYGEVWLMDWGVARRVGQVEAKYTDEPSDPAPSAQIRTTRHGSIVGTPAYMAPEQARGDLGAIDARSDLYAACVLFHELVTLRHYLDEHGTSLPGLLTAVETLEVGFLHLYRGVPDEPLPPVELIHFVRKGFAKKPEERWQSAAEMVAGLHGVLEGKVKVQCTATFTKRVLREAGRFTDRHPNLGFIALIAGAGALLSAAGVLLWHLV